MSERSVQVAATSARATRCGYNFDAGKLKASYIAYETGQGAAADRVVKLYDQTLTLVNRSIGPSETYCTDDQTAKIKSDLTRHLAGDFSPPPKKPEVASDWWSGGTKSTEFDRKKVLCPTGNCL